MSRLFGWSLPPGCVTLPGEEDCYCAVCGSVDDKCVCPECPVCGEVGNPDCYKPHLVLNEAQLERIAENEKAMKEENER